MRVDWLALGLLLVTQVGQAFPEESAQPPDMEFLEFLGTWEPGDEPSLDPSVLENLPALDETELGREEALPRAGEPYNPEEWSRPDSRQRGATPGKPNGPSQVQDGE